MVKMHQIVQAIQQSCVEIKMQKKLGLLIVDSMVHATTLLANVTVNHYILDLIAVNPRNSASLILLRSCSTWKECHGIMDLLRMQLLAEITGW